MDQVIKICRRFFHNKGEFNIHQIEGGLINLTYKVSFETGDSYILQAINTRVFTDPQVLMINIQNIAIYLQKSNFPLKILIPFSSANELLEKDEFGNYWRVFPFIENTTVFEKVTHQNQAFEAAKSFGLFIKYLDGIDLKSVKETIPNFHNLNYRETLFENVFSQNQLKKNDLAKNEINKIQKLFNTMNFDFEKLPLRIVHNDTKVSNVLLDKKGEKGVCVIDLDTVMPGYAVTDFGDMVRTMCCTASEEEYDLDKVAIDIDYFKATAGGFAMALKSVLTQHEKENLIPGCIYIIFEQALRFLTDFLQGDIYYPTSYEYQNLFRARNQLKLLESLLAQKPELEIIIKGLF